ncbi:unnamed protein product [Ixodes pacificus]
MILVNVCSFILGVGSGEILPQRGKSEVRALLVQMERGKRQPWQGRCFTSPGNKERTQSSTICRVAFLKCMPSPRSLSPKEISIDILTVDGKYVESFYTKLPRDLCSICLRHSMFQVGPMAISMPPVVNAVILL